MSEENVELVRRGYAAFNRGDVDAVVADFARDFEYVAMGMIPGITGVYRGTEGYKRFMRTFWDEFDDARNEVHEFVDAGDQVLVTQTVHGRGKQSRAEGSWTFSILWTVRDGKVVRGQGFASRDQALDAAGLEE